jgi:hypothetical protein
VHSQRGRALDGRTRAAGSGWRILREIGDPVEFSIVVGEIKDGTKIGEWRAIEPNDEMDVDLILLWCWMTTGRSLANPALADAK